MIYKQYITKYVLDSTIGDRCFVHFTKIQKIWGYSRIKIWGVENGWQNLLMSVNPKHKTLYDKLKEDSGRFDETDMCEAE